MKLFFWCEMMLQSRRIFAFFEQQWFHFFCDVQSHQNTFIFIERMFRKRDSAVAQIASSDRLLQEQGDQEGRSGCGRDFCRSHRFGRARQRVTPGFLARCWTRKELVPCIESVRAIATGFTPPDSRLDEDSRLARGRQKVISFPLKTSLRLNATAYEELNRNTMKKWAIEKLVLEKDAAMNARSICLSDMEKNVATIKIEKEPLSKLHAELLASARWKGAKGTCMGDDSNLSIPLLYLGFVFNVEESRCAISLWSILRVSHFFFWTTKHLAEAWGARGDLRVPRKYGPLFALKNPFRFCLSLVHYALIILSVEEVLQKIVERETGEDQWTKLLPT